MRISHKSAYFFFYLLIVLVLTNSDSNASSANTSTERVYVSIGKPVVKSLRDAHYLLEEVRARARNLAITPPSSLDPSATNVYQLDVLQTLVGLNATFSQMTGKQNDFLLQDRQLFIDQQRELLSQRSSLWNQQLEIVRKLGDAQTKLSQRKFKLKNNQELIDADATANALKEKVDQLTSQKAVVDTQLAQIKTQLDSIGDRPGTPENVGDAPGITTDQPSSADHKVDSDLMAELIKSVTNSAPSPHYSVQLNRYIEAEYELVAKHLSLLRSQISPDEDLVFFELPHSVINVVPKKADDYLIRAEWSIEKVVIDKCEKSSFTANRNNYYLENPNRTTDQSGGQDEPETFFEETGDAQAGRPTEEKIKAADTEPAGTENGNSKRNSVQTLNAQTADKIASEEKVEEGLQRDSEVVTQAIIDDEVSCKEEVTISDKYEARVLEVIPGQNALSVEDTVGKVSGLNIGAAFTWLTGFGASASIDRQRQNFNKSIAQKVFAAGYGIGENTFGWTFSPIPGSRRIDPGIKKTYAVAVVPRLTENISFSSKWCAFHRKTSPPEQMEKQDKRRVICGDQEAFDVEVVNAHESFWVDEVLFSSVVAGEPASVFIYGDGFPNNIRVSVNSVPLRQVISMDELANTSNQELLHSSWGGVFQRSREWLHLVFKMDSDYFGTPLITLSTPARNSVVNFIPKIKINNDQSTSLARYGHEHPLFRGQLSVRDVTTRVIYDTTNPSIPSEVSLTVSGTGFKGHVDFYLNGEPLKGAKYRTEGLVEYLIPVNGLREKTYTLVARENRTQGGRDVIYEQEIANPLYPTITNTKLLSFDESTRNGLLRIDFVGDTRSLEFVDLGNSRQSIKNDSMPGRVLLMLTKQKNVISVGVKSKALDELVEYVVISAPSTPSVISIENPADNNKPQGKIDGGYVVSINGRNLDHVGTVYFGSNQAEILQKSAALLRVRVPKGDSDSNVRVILETSVLVNGSPLNNLSDFVDANSSRFKYKKPDNPSAQQANQSTPPTTKPNN